MRQAIMHRHEYYFEEGCFITELHNSAADAAVSVARARVRPGETTRWHRLRGICERYLIMEGSGVVEMGGDAPVAVGPGATVVIAAGVRQRITNTGNMDLIFLAVCTPRFVIEAYEEVQAREDAARR